jgi:hypothetical protein
MAQGDSEDAEAMLVLLVVVGMVAAGLYMHLRVMARWLTELQEERAALRASLHEAMEHVTRLTKQDGSADAEAYIARVLMAGRAAAEAMKLSAEATLDEAREQAEAILDAAHLKSQSLAAQAYAARELAEQFQRRLTETPLALAAESAVIAGNQREVFGSDGMDATGIRINSSGDLSTYELKVRKSI